MVRGGLIANSRGRSPSEDPKGYAIQERLGSENAVRLAKGFATRGFSSIIDAFDVGVRKVDAELLRNLRPLPVYKVRLTASPETIATRWVARGWGRGVPRSRLMAAVTRQIRSYAKAQGEYDCTVDTSTLGPGRCVRTILAHLQP